jgi:hypothetical protein
MRAGSSEAVDLEKTMIYQGENMDTKMKAAGTKRVRYNDLPIGFRMAANPWVIRKYQIKKKLQRRLAADQ